MSTEQFIPLETLSTHYQVEVSFFISLGDIGLIELTVIGQVHYLHEDHIPDVEKMIRLHRELDLNSESIDVVWNLLQKIEHLHEELAVAKSRLKLYEE